MEQLLHNLSTYELSMLSISIVFTIIFIIQVILTFSGLTIDSLDTFGGAGDDGASFFHNLKHDNILRLHGLNRLYTC